MNWTKSNHLRSVGWLTLTVCFVAFGNEKFHSLFEAEKYLDAVQFADKQIPPADRDADVWVKLAIALDKTNASKEKVLSCYKAAQKANPSDPRIYSGFGKVEFDAGRYPAAVENYQKSFVLERTAAAAEGIAMAAAKMGDWDKARDAAESAIGIDSSVLDSRLILTEIFLNKKDHKKAAEQLERVVQKKPASLDHWRQLLACYEKTGNAQRTAEIDPKIVDLDKKDVPSRRRLVETSLTQKDSARAYDLSKELAILTPNDPKVFKTLYQIAYARGGIKDAILYLKNYLVLDSTSAVPFKLLGDLLFEQKDADGALEAYRRALKVDPAIKGFYKRYEEMVLQKGLEKEAVKVIRGAIAAGEANSQSYIALGNIYKKEKLYGDAVKMYQDALKTETSDLTLLRSLGECQAKSGDTKGAVVTYEQIVLMDGKASEEFKALGDLNWQIGKQDAAVSAYKKYLDKNSRDTKTAKQVGLYSHEKKQYNEAIKYLLMVKDSALQDVQYTSALGEAYYYSGDFKHAAEQLSKLRGKGAPTSVLKTSLKLLADAYEKSGEPLKAADAYDSYSGLQGVSDPDAAYKRAALREKTNKAQAIKMYQANVKEFPKDSRSFTRLGMIYSEDKTTTVQAASMLRAASALDDGSKEIWEKLVDVYGKLKDEEKELGACKKLLTLDAQNMNANRRAGFLLLKKGQTSPAIEHLEMVLTVQPKDGEAMLALADGYLKTKRPAQAISLLAKAKEINKDDAKIRFQLYQLYKEANQAGDAEKEIRQLIDLTKENKYRVMYVKDLIAEKKYDDARGQVKIIMASDFQNVEGLMLLAKVNTLQGKHRDAIETYKTILYIDENFAPALCERAGVHFAMSELDLAKTYFNKALKADPKSATAELGLAKVAKQEKNATAYNEHFNRAKALDPKLIQDETPPSKM